MRNLTSRKLAKHKLEKLELVYLDIAGPLPTSIRGNRVFLQVVDSATRRTWSLPLPSKDAAIEALRQWRKKEELQTRTKVKGVRSDNVPELKKIMDQ